jgi:hypothetical protein
MAPGLRWPVDAADVLVRMPVVQFLRDCGYRVVEAASTDEAIVPTAPAVRP